MIAEVQLLIKGLFESFFLFYNSVGDYVFAFYANYSRLILDWIHVGSEFTFYLLLYITIVITIFYFYMALVVLIKRKPTSGTLAKGEEPFITVQIPTFNELAALHCAQACVDNDYPHDRLQIIIGDDSSDKSVSEKIDEFAAKYPGLVLVTRRGGNEGYKPGNLNHMLPYSKGDYLVLFDSDFLPGKDFLRRIVAPFVKQKGVSVVQARWDIANFGQNIYSILGGSISLLSHYIALPFMTYSKGNGFLCGSAESISKKDLIAVGGWTSGALTEDIECSLRLMKKGYKLVYLEDLQCACEAPQTFRDLCKQQLRWAHGVITAFKMHLVDLLKSPKTIIQDKFTVMIFASGYLFSMLLIGITFFGILSIISNRPAPIDWGLFLSETVRNILLTSGFLVATIISMAQNKKLKYIWKMIGGAFTIGLLVTYNVVVGITLALFNRPVQWFMLKKNGNNV